MTINRETKLKELMEAFPWLLDEAVNLDPKFKILNNPVGKAFIKNATIADLSRKSGLTVNEILDWIREAIGRRRGQGKENARKI